MTPETLDHLREPVEKQAFDLFGWHCQKCQITVFNLLGQLLATEKGK